MTRNNKIWMAAGVVLVLAAGITLFLVFRKTIAMENVFPADPVFYARLDHAAQNITRAGESAFWKNISAIDLPKIMARNNFFPSQVDKARQLLDGIKVFAQNPWARMVFGKEVAFGFYGKDGFLFAIRLEPSVGAAELVSRLGTQWGEGVSTSSRDYQGTRIITVNTKKDSAAFKYARLRDVIVAAPAASAMLEKAVDVYRKQGPGINADGDFAFVAGRAYPKAQGIVYVNARALNGVLEQKAAAWGAQDLDELLARTSGIRSYGMSFLPGEVNHWKLIMGVDPALMNPETRKAFSCPPAEHRPVKFVPPGIIAYQWGGCYDFKQMWDQAREQARAAPLAVEAQARKIKRRLEKRLGVKVEGDVLPLLGHEAGGYLTDVDITGTFPYPRLLVFLKIRDRERTEQLLARLSKNPMLFMRDENYGRTRFRYMVLPLGANMDPGYCFIDDYLVFSSSRQLLKKSIDTASDASRSLAADKTARAFGLSASRKTNAVSFVRLDALARRMRELLDWADKYMSSQVTMAAAFKREGEIKKEEIARDIAAKTAELKLAERKILELQATPAADVPREDPAAAQGIIENLKQDVQAIRDDIKTYAAQRDELDASLAQYQGQARAAKLWMFNSQQAAVPVLKGLEAMHALGMNMNLTGQSLETEIFLN